LQNSIPDFPAHALATTMEPALKVFCGGIMLQNWTDFFAVVIITTLLQ